MPRPQKHLEYCSIPFELKRAPQSEADMTFSGYASVFNNIDSYGDTIVPGAFSESIARAKRSGRWPAMLMQHGGFGLAADDMNPIGIWTSLEEDDKGLLAAGKLADTTRGTDIYKLMKMEPRPAIDSLSIGFVVKEAVANENPKPGEARRTIKKIDLWEISPVTFPANAQALIGNVKSDELLTNPREFERALREGLGLSSRAAKAFMAIGFKGLASACDGRASQDQIADVACDGREALEELAKAVKRGIAILKPRNNHSGEKP